MQQKILTAAPVSAFTLIELLIVVLIIGILTAIALPQYQVSVDKTRFTTMMNATQSLKQEQELYYITNGVYSSDLRIFQHILPTQCGEATAETVRCDSFSISLENARIVSTLTQDPGNVLILWYDFSYNSTLRRECVAFKSQGERARRVCQSLGPKRHSSVDGGCEGNCTSYVF